MNDERDPAETSGSRSSVVDASATPIILEVIDLSKSFGPVRAVQNLSLDVRVGEVHAVCGHS
jgi:ABC-type sugar transport system ATPase subunit